MLVLDQVKEPLVATDEEAVIAKEAAEKLRSAAIAGVDVWLGVAEKADVVVPLPARAVEMIVAVLTAMAERKPISLTPHTAELTAQQAADFLTCRGRIWWACSKKNKFHIGRLAATVASVWLIFRRSRKN